MTTPPNHSAAKYLLVTKGSIEIVEAEPNKVWMFLIDLKYPNGFISLTVMEELDGPY